MEKGLYGQGLSMENKKEFDWSSIEDADSLGDFKNFMLNFETDTTNMNNNKDLVKNSNNNEISMIDLPGETIDMRSNKKQFIETPSESSATNVAFVNPINPNNKYMNEFPDVAGFNDSVYS